MKKFEEQKDYVVNYCDEVKRGTSQKTGKEWIMYKIKTECGKEGIIFESLEIGSTQNLVLESEVNGQYTNFSFRRANKTDSLEKRIADLENIVRQHHAILKPKQEAKKEEPQGGGATGDEDDGLPF